MTSYIIPLPSGKCSKEGKNYKNMNISRTKRVFYMKEKTVFIAF